MELINNGQQTAVLSRSAEMVGLVSRFARGKPGRSAQPRPAYDHITRMLRRQRIVLQSTAQFPLLPLANVPTSTAEVRNEPESGRGFRESSQPFRIHPPAAGAQSKWPAYSARAALENVVNEDAVARLAHVAACPPLLAVEKACFLFLLFAPIAASAARYLALCRRLCSRSMLGA